MAENQAQKMHHDTGAINCSNEQLFLAKPARGYPDCDEVLLLLDAGGANSYRCHELKHEMLKLAQRTGLIFRIAHYPSYCSKWNPIEHRLFPHVNRSLEGVYLDSIDTVREYIEERANTATGLHTRAYILDTEFEKGIKSGPLPEDFSLVPCDQLPKWNYKCYPTPISSNNLN